MKKLLTCLLLVAFLSANAQTADEVVQKYAATMGGLDAINQIKTVKMSGSYSVQGMHYPMTIQIINNKGMRSDIDISGTIVTSVYFNGTGWKLNPFANVNTATDVTGSELADFRWQSSIANQLIDYKNRGHKIELMGQETFDGITCYKIKLTTKDDNKVSHYFISTKDNILVKSTTMRDLQGQEIEVATLFSNLKDFNGIKFFMTRSSEAAGQVFQEINFTTIELNVPVDEKIFNK
jgi:opacity protein-like surface antigen